MKENDRPSNHVFNIVGCKQFKIVVSDNSVSLDKSGVYGIAEIIMDKSEIYHDSSKTIKTLEAGEQYLLNVVTPHATPSRYDGASIMSMGGYYYTNGFSCMGYGDYIKGNLTSFNLDGKYKQISFDAGIILDRDLEVTFKFYADGKKVYEFSMDKGELPTTHSFSVENCSELTVSVSDHQRDASTSGTYGLANIIVS